MGNESSTESVNAAETDMRKNTAEKHSRPPPAMEVSAGSFGRKSSPRNHQGRRSSDFVLITDGKYETRSLMEMWSFVAQSKLWNVHFMVPVI